MKTSEILAVARAKIEQGWCQGSFAKTASSESICSSSPDAIRWCTMGAINAGSWALVPEGVLDDAPARMKALSVVESCLNGALVATWNDDPVRTKEEVLAKLEEAQQVALKEEAAQ